MKQYMKTPSAVTLLLLREGMDGKEILLQKRKNTGYMDGMWDLAASGHVEEKESMKVAMCREAKEELKIELASSDLVFASLMHKYSFASNVTYYNAFFVATVYEGIPYINEPDKCEALEWFALNQLPTDLIADRKQAIANYIAGVVYDEFGWEENK